MATTKTAAHTIRIATTRGMVEVPIYGSMLGEWCVHKPRAPARRGDGTPWTKQELSDLTRGWVVSHAPTGLRAAHFESFDDAIVAARALTKVKVRGLADGPGLDAVRRVLGLPVPAKRKTAPAKRKAKP